MKRVFRKGRYANVTSTMALVVALGGTAYAANTIRSSDIVNGQVKRVDLANNAVTSGKVKNGTLLKKDIKASELASLKGATGATGATGAIGATGAAGVAGATGATGPSDAFGGFRDPFLDVGAGTTVLGTLPLQPGKYVITAKQYLNNNGAAGNRVACQLAAGGDTDTTPGDITFAGGDGADDRRVVPFMVVHTFAAAGSAVLSCTVPSGGAGTVNAAQTKIIAIRVGNLSNVGI